MGAGRAPPFAEAGMQSIVLNHSVNLGPLEAVDGSWIAAVQEGAARGRQLRLKHLHQNAACRTAAVGAFRWNACRRTLLRFWIAVQPSDAFERMTSEEQPPGAT